MPGERNFLSGGFGDLRENHFHAGIDIKTQQREGLPVYAAAEGYVSKVRVMTSGYGNVIYITHPNGFQTVYGHLLRFNERIGNYVRNRQYQQESFEVDIVPLPGELPISKLEIIGLSGNSGGSGGPHLHFEVRDAKDNVINPLNFGFGEVLDEVAPQLRQLALVPLSPEARINGEYRRQVFPLLRKPGVDYYLDKTIVVSGEIGIELLGYDLTSGSQNLNGITSVEVTLDGKEIWQYDLETYSNDISKDINVHINYAVQELTGQRFQRLFLADGNRMPIYQRMPSMGRININDNGLHQVSIRASDTYQNTSFLNFALSGSGIGSQDIAPKPTKQAMSLTTEIDDNALIVRAKNVKSSQPTANGYFNRRQRNLPLAYIKGSDAIFIYDLRKGIPDSLEVEGILMPTYLKSIVLPGRNRTIEEKRYSIAFDSESLYDTLYLTQKETHNGLQVGEPTVPLKGAITIRFRPQNQGFDKSKTMMYNVSGGRPRYLGGTWKGNEIEFKTRELGTFALITDAEPPKARIARKDTNSFTAIISDGLSGIERFRATANGEWVLLNYDYKRALLWSDKLDKIKPFTGDLVLEIRDRAGNVTLVNDNFNEPIPLPEPKKVIKKAPVKKKKRK